MRHGHFHQHKLERQKYICPFAEMGTCPNGPAEKWCYHRKPHIEHSGCRQDEECPQCVRTQDVIDEETFTEEEFEI